MKEPPGTNSNLEEIRARFEVIAATPDCDIKLDEAALIIAAETQPSLDVNACLKNLDVLANNFEASSNQNTQFGVSVNGLIDYIHNELGFSGNVRDYYDPSNSYLNRVLEHKVGIPITLAIVHLALGERLNIPVAGINFPGHFLVKYGDAKGQYVDPFTGRILSEPDCATLLKQIAGPRAVLESGYFEIARAHDIMVRILDNLKQIFWRNKQWLESRKCIERQMILRPTAEEYTIQLGALHEMQGEYTLASSLYSSVLSHSQNENIKEIASKRLIAMAGTNTTVH